MAASIATTTASTISRTDDALSKVAGSVSGAGAGSVLGSVVSSGSRAMSSGGARQVPRVESNLDKWENESIGTSASGMADSAAAREAKPIDPEKKAELVESIRGWIKLENEMKELNKALSERRKRKKALTTTLLGVMKDHNIDCFDVNKGSLVYTKNKVKMPVNKQHLLTCLLDVYKDPEEALKITQYILSTRKEKIVESIKMKLDE